MCLDILNGEFIEINHPSLANIHFHGKFDSFPVVYSIPFWSFKDNIGYTITLPDLYHPGQLSATTALG